MAIPLQAEQLALYRHSLEKAGWYLRPKPGALKIEGADRVQFIQRQSTNDVRKLTPERAIQTVLTSPTARILDVLTLMLDGDAILAATLPGLGNQTYQFLKSRIFFMDKVNLSDASASYAQIELAGPQAAGLLRQAGFAAGEKLDEVRRTALNGGDVFAVRQAGWSEEGYLLLANEPAVAPLVEALQTGGAAKLDETTYQTLRIEAGLPAPGAELSESFTPLEANLELMISSAKGCYTGQEIIARQVTYDKITQRLCGISLEQAAAPGSKVLVDGKNAGEISSYACSPDFGHIALAVLKKPAFEPGKNLLVLDGEQSIHGVVSQLPFRR